MRYSGSSLMASRPRSRHAGPAPSGAWCGAQHTVRPGGPLRLQVMGQVRVGTASWTDRTLIESGWYPPEADTPEKRLRYYARQFALVEVDATYYALPAEQTAQAWAARTPAGFTFNVKAFSCSPSTPPRWPRCPRTCARPRRRRARIVSTSKTSNSRWSTRCGNGFWGRW